MNGASDMKYYVLLAFSIGAIAGLVASFAGVRSSSPLERALSAERKDFQSGRASCVQLRLEEHGEINYKYC